MFCDTNLINSEILGKTWKLAHNIPVDNIEKSNLPKTCKELDSWISSETVTATRRLSLRASSNLIAGTAKLYKQSLDKLYDDVKEMNEDLIYRRKRERPDSSSSENTDSIAETTVKDPEQMRRSAMVGFVDSSFSPRKARRIEPILKMTDNITMSRSPNENLLGNVTNSNEEASHKQGSNGDNLDTEHMEKASRSSIGVNSVNDVEEPFSEGENHESQRKDEGVLTSPILTSRRTVVNRGTNTNSCIEHGFDGNVPFGYIFIHDNYGSKIPSRIIFTSINSNVNNLI